RDAGIRCDGSEWIRAGVRRAFPGKLDGNRSSPTSGSLLSNVVTGADTLNSSCRVHGPLVRGNAHLRSLIVEHLHAGVRKPHKASQTELICLREPKYPVAG